MFAVFLVFILQIVSVIGNQQNCIAPLVYLKAPQKCVWFIKEV